MTGRFYLFIICLIFGFSAHSQDCILNPPAGLYLSDETSCSVTLHWTSSASVNEYLIVFKASGTSQWSPSVSAGLDTLFRFMGLTAGKEYDFGVQSKCQDGSESPITDIPGNTLLCMPPANVAIKPINTSSVQINVKTKCPYLNLRVKYHTLTGPSTIQTFPFAESYFVNELHWDSTYIFEVTTCKLEADGWSNPDTVILPRPPNILFILVDDSRAEYYSCCGAFPFMHTPNIDRIANEGVNFRNAYVATSLCAPSRATIATGLFTLKTGITENGVDMDTSFVTIPEVLGEHGYYTAIVGKNHATFFNGNIPEFKYYLVSLDESQYNQTFFNWNGVNKFITKPNVETLTDTTIGLINKIDDPFFIWLAYRVPHYPNLVLPSNLGKYDGIQIPWGPDTGRYKINYPSYMYEGNEAAWPHGYEMDSIYRDILEDIAGLDSCVGEIFDALENSGKLDNTLLVFMSDNGFTLGSHWLNGKTHAYECSMRVPLLARYPEWFTAGTVFTDRFASNMDIAPTFYDAAEVDYTGQLDGRSIKDLYDGEFQRSSVYYLMLHNPDAGSPTKRAFRDKYFKYINYTCNSDTVVELFDMVNDPLELTNLINNHNYDSIQEVYKMKFDSSRVVWGDTADGPVKDCFVKNPFVLKEMYEDADEMPQDPVVYPTITKEYVEVYMPWNNSTVILYNDYGQIIQRWIIAETYSRLNLPHLSSGVYYLQFSDGDKNKTEKIVVSGEM